MSVRPRPAATACLTRKWFGVWSRASAELAEYTITRPKKISSTTVVKSTLSNASFFAIRPSDDAPHQLLEDLAAVDEVPELIEAGASRREDDGLARLSLAGGRAHRAVEGLRYFVGDGSIQSPLEVAGGLADEIGAARFPADHRRQRGEVRLLVAAAEDEVDRAVGEALDGLQRGAGIGPLGVVVEGDAAALSHPLQAVGEPGEARQGGADGRRLGAHGPRQQGRRHGVLEVLHAGERHLRGMEELQLLGALDDAAVVARPTAVGDRIQPREEPPPGARRDLDGAGIVGVEHGDAVGVHALEQPLLGGAVLRHARVAVEVVLRQV